MSFSLFNQDTDLKECPSPYPLPLERGKKRMTHSHKMTAYIQMMAYIQEMQHLSRRGHIWKKTAYIRKVAEESLSWGRAIMAASPPGN